MDPRRPKPPSPGTSAPGTPPRRRGSVGHRVGEDLARVAAAAAAPAAPSDLSARRVNEELLRRLAFDVDAGPEHIRALTGAGGTSLRVALLVAAAHLRPPDTAAAREALVGRVAPWLGIDALGSATQGGAGEAESAALLGAVTAALETFVSVRLVTEGAAELVGVEREFLVQLAELFVEHLAFALERGARVPARVGLARALASAQRSALVAALVPEVFGAVLASPKASPLRATVVQVALAALNTGAGNPHLAALVRFALAREEHTLDPHLTRALASLVGALEAETAHNLRRRAQGEPTQWSLPMRAGDGWVTAQLEEDPPRGPGAASRLAVGVELPALGAVRADLVVSAGRVVARLTAATAETARLLELERAELTRALGDVEVVIAVAHGAEHEARVAPPTMSVDHLDLRA